MFPDMPSEEINNALETSFGNVDLAASYLIDSKQKIDYKSSVFCNIIICCIVLISITFSPGKTIEEVPEHVQSSDTESDSELLDTSLSNSRQIVPRGKFIFL